MALLERGMGGKETRTRRWTGLVWSWDCLTVVLVLVADRATAEDVSVSNGNSKAKHVSNILDNPPAVDPMKLAIPQEGELAVTIGLFCLSIHEAIVKWEMAVWDWLALLAL